jgi:hypothetical protein
MLAVSIIRALIALIMEASSTSELLSDYTAQQPRRRQSSRQNISYENDGEQ